MNTRLYPITEEYFKKHIDCYLVEFKDGRGRPPLIKNYDFPDVDLRAIDIDNY